MSDTYDAPEAADAPAVSEDAAPAPENRSLGDIIGEAFDKVDGEEQGGTPEQTQETRVRDPETGRFVAKEGEAPAEGEETAEDKPDDKPAGFGEPPSRFSPDAKAAWKEAPEPVRAEVHRAVKELEQGIEKYRGDAQAYEPLKQYADLAQKYGTTLESALANYTRMEMTLKENPIEGLKAVFDYIRMDPRQFAQAIMKGGEAPQEGQSSQDQQTIRALQDQIRRLEQQVGGVTQTFQQQREAEVQKQIDAFAAEKPRFEELAPDIAFFIKSGRTNDLAEAYALAEKLNPAPQAQVPAAQAAPQQEPRAHTPQGNLSISGAPSSGSNPANRKPPSSPRAALDRAFEQVGAG